MNKIEKQLINKKRQEWKESQIKEFEELNPELDRDTPEYNEAYSNFMLELEQYEVTTTSVNEYDEEIEVTNTFSRKVRPMPKFNVTDQEILEYKLENYREFRQYPDIKEQLDKLWHDIDNGLLGSAVKFSEFYLTIKKAKDEYPKG